MTLFIKNMVSLRCILFVQEVLDKCGIPYQCVKLGEAELAVNPTPVQCTQFKDSLLKGGLDLIDDKTNILTEKVRNEIIKMIHHSDELPAVNYSCYISEKIGKDYTYLANLFSRIKGMTIRQFIIAHRIERVKEMLVEEDLPLTEISYRLHYSSVAHLSNQFKKITGLTPSLFRSMEGGRRTSLEQL